MTDCSCSHHPSDSSGFVSGLMVGVIVGAAAAHFLNNTERGREILDNIKENAGDALKEVVENPALAEKMKDLEKTVAEARKTINSAAERVAEATEPAEADTSAAPKKNFFKSLGRSLGK